MPETEKITVKGKRIITSDTGQKVEIPNPVIVKVKP